MVGVRQLDLTGADAGDQLPLLGQRLFELGVGLAGGGAVGLVAAQVADHAQIGGASVVLVALAGVAQALDVDAGDQIGLA